MSAKRKPKSNVASFKDKKKADALELLRESFDLPTLAAVVKRGGSDSTYELKLEDGSFIVLGSAYEVHQQAKVRAKLFDARARMPKHDARAWDDVLDAIRDAAEEVETFTEAEELMNYVAGYVKGQRTGKGEYGGLREMNLDLETAEASRDEERFLNTIRHRRHKGFVDGRRVYLSQAGFTLYINLIRSGRFSERDVAEMLSRHGFEYKQKTVAYVNASGERRTVNAGRFWWSPEGYLDEQEAASEARGE